eukprot:TRINITY_DN570_c2_g1_i2.p1 TRINITY_DN570_c2_g1~~TRINITY_DN570_c2_g1_i2.p1  ORF type:complete len:790 (+),score=169.74 TRINITY_DN570_c2_g1_i2:23-2371(+)
MDVGDVSARVEKAKRKTLTKVRGLVSGQRVRYQDNGFDLDLTYITDRIIAMGFPAENKMEMAIRNPLEEVRQFLENKHGDNYCVFNLSLEKQYDSGKFYNKTKSFGWPDHHAPTLDMLFDVVAAVDEYLKQDEANVAVLHCKAGKGRTGTAIASYLVYTGLFTEAKDAMEFFGGIRSTTNTGVEVGSQRRYVDYLARIVNGTASRDVVSKSNTLVLKQIILQPTPDIDKIKGGIRPVVEVYQIDRHQIYKLIYRNSVKTRYDFKKGHFKVIIELDDQRVVVHDDIMIKIYHKQDLVVSKSPPLLLFRYALHCGFVKNYDGRLAMTEDSAHKFKVGGNQALGIGRVVSYGALELDGPTHGRLKDSRFPPDFQVVNFFELCSDEELRNQNFIRSQSEELVSPATDYQEVPNSHYEDLRNPQGQQGRLQKCPVCMIKFPPNMISRHIEKCTMNHSPSQPPRLSQPIMSAPSSDPGLQRAPTGKLIDASTPLSSRPVSSSLQTTPLDSQLGMGNMYIGPQSPNNNPYSASLNGSGSGLYTTQPSLQQPIYNGNTSSFYQSPQPLNGNSSSMYSSDTNLNNTNPNNSTSSSSSNLLNPSNNLYSTSNNNTLQPNPGASSPLPLHTPLQPSNSVQQSNNNNNNNNTTNPSVVSHASLQPIPLQQQSPQPIYITQPPMFPLSPTPPHLHPQAHLTHQQLLQQHHQMAQQQQQYLLQLQMHNQMMQNALQQGGFPGGMPPQFAMNPGYPPFAPTGFQPFPFQPPVAPSPYPLSSQPVSSPNSPMNNETRQ